MPPHLHERRPSEFLLETVMQTELYLSWGRANVAYLAKIAVSYIVVRISVAGNVKDVKEIRTKSNGVFAPYVKFFEHRSIDLTIARRPLGVNARRAESW